MNDAKKTDGNVYGLPLFDNRTSLLTKCAGAKNEKQNYYNKIAIIAPNSNVNARAKVFFEGYFLEASGLNGLVKEIKPARTSYKIETF